MKQQQHLFVIKHLWAQHKQSNDSLWKDEERWKRLTRKYLLQNHLEKGVSWEK